MNKLLQKNEKIKLLLLDFEGVLFLNKKDFEELISEKSESVIKNFFKVINKYKIKCGIVTGRKNDEALKALCKKGFEVLSSASLNKLGAVEKISNHLKIPFNNIFYIGDDILDIPLLQKVGFSVAPKNTRREVKRIANCLISFNSALELLEQLTALLKGNYKEQ